MTPPARFQLSPRARLLTPEAPGLSALLKGLEAGSSLHARQTGGEPLLLSDEARQWLTCESTGTSGPPKTIRRSPASWIASFELHRTLLGVSEADTHATLGALGHSLTLFATLEALHLGAGLAALGGASPKAQARALAAHRVSTLYATPAQLRLLARGAKAAGLTLPDLKRILSGGGKLDAALKAALEELCPEAEIREFFGAAETSFITLSDAHTPEGSVGRAYPGVELRITEGAHEVPQGETGEIWVRSPYLFEGYAAGDAPETRWQGGWLAIGEMGRLDAGGHLSLRGRKSRMVTVADHNVFPEEIEAVALGLPGVTLAAALTLPDATRGTSITCVLEAADDPGLEPRLRAACRARLGAASVPRRVVVLARMPLLPGGKPDLQRLARDLEATP
ncbi:MAG: fatty acid--CoA ligase family protein [Roseovarius sp.]